jgi:hypothetical protein
MQFAGIDGAGSRPLDGDALATQHLATRLIEEELSLYGAAMTN